MDSSVKLDRPIFLVGCAKSGTTFLSLLLSMNPQIGPLAPDKDKYVAQDYIDAMLNENVFGEVAHQIEKKEIWDNYFPIQVPLRIGAELTLLNNPLTDIQTQDLVRALTKDFKAQRFLGKQPFNTFRLHVLREIFPACKLIAIHRDGRDVIASWGRTKTNGWQAYGGYESAIKIYARKWNESVDHIDYYKNTLDVLTIRYEDLVFDMKNELKRIFKHCELEYDPEIYDDLQSTPRIGRWVELVPAQHHQLVNDLTARNRERLGYLSDEYNSGKQGIYSSFDKGFKGFYEATSKKMYHCPICDSRSFETICVENRHDINLPTAVCKQCGLIQTNPRPSKEWYGEFYKDWFWSTYIGNESCDLEDLYVRDRQDYKGKVIGDFIFDTVSECNEVKFLDIGCGLGGLVNYIKKQRPNWSVTALDPSEKAIDFVKSRSPDIRFMQRSLDELHLLEEQFDVISVVHVLEHCLEPIEFLTQIKNLLAENGIIYIEVPDFYSEHWNGKGFFHIAHNLIFDRQTLKFSLNRAGLAEQEFYRSPVNDIWPWAISVFARKSGNVLDQHKITVSAEEIQKKSVWVNSKIHKKTSTFFRIKSIIGPGFPGPRTLIRLLRRKGWK